MSSALLSVVLCTTCLLLFLVCLTLAVHRVPRTHGHNALYHKIFLSCALTSVFLLPPDIRAIVCSPLSVMVAGTVLPVYESIRAVCTLGTTDDTEWLQYWVVYSTLSYCTEWIQDLSSPMVTAHWYVLEMIILLWLLLPYTDGASLVFQHVTTPYLQPLVQPYVQKMGEWYTKVVLMVINASHLWVLWLAFVVLDPRLKRFVVVSVGTIYPCAASLVAVSTSEGLDDTYWLTYWSAYSILILLMDFLQVFLGKIPGFYTLALFFTMYLMLPLFHGAEEVFRHVLVPIAGMQEMLMQRDVLNLKKDVMKRVPKEKRLMFFKDIRKHFEDFVEEEQENEKDNKGSFGGTGRTLGYQATEGGYQDAEGTSLIV